MVKRWLVILTVLGACGGSAWPQEEQAAFLDNCERTSGGQTSMCVCALEKAQEAESDPNDITTGQMLDIAQECSS